MKGKFLLGGVILSGWLMLGQLTTVKQAVSAEPKEFVTLQKETALSMTASTVDSSNSTAEESVESTEPLTTSSIEESKSNETAKSSDSTILASEQKEKVQVIQGTTTDNIQTAIPAKKVETNYQFSVSKNRTTEEFIQTIGKDAQTIAWNEELYASVMIAQAILETGSGNSQLALPPYHNLFGIKGSYQGKQVSFKTQEDKGNGELYTIQSIFRQYPSYKESLEDYAALLKEGISGNASFYHGTWKSNAATHQKAAKALTGKYATDTAYDKKLIALIEAYNLTSYDQAPTESVEAVQEQSADDPIKLEVSSEEKQLTEASSESSGQELLVNQTKKPVIVIPPAAQRPAKQLSGNRIIQ
ncbi:glucosaminidase domain-containing protein [Candidatus Enterococcus ferrettii]|uniref:Mannosyl-glycoprotein endo-beta-N-acetylglucosamidase-like domain-containing protein n=1 Tax=Candidatus Enterococcus ferrettii TaxID=2815324 RepID=A0ABV0ER36_9ENTE|nr:glucosaminidase domain-containing protein [Enterococcus sp. 665A]MBO1342418.1 glucosaminidase domain-containing protein [Enterococcus sp. 665A]